MPRITPEMQDRVRQEFDLMAALRVNGSFDCPEHPKDQDVEEDYGFCTCDTAQNVSLSKIVDTKTVFVQEWESTLISNDVCFLYHGGTSALEFGAWAERSPTTFTREFLKQDRGTGRDSAQTESNMIKQKTRSLGYSLGWFDPAIDKEHLIRSMLKFWAGRVRQWDKIGRNAARERWPDLCNEAVLSIDWGEADHPAEAMILPVVKNYQRREVGYEVLVIKDCPQGCGVKLHEELASSKAMSDMAKDCAVDWFGLGTQESGLVLRSPARVG